MSLYMASVNAYDCMDTVHVIVSVRSTTADRSEAIESLLHTATTIPGVGESDPREWLRDVLIGALEAL